VNGRKTLCYFEKKFPITLVDVGYYSYTLPTSPYFLYPALLLADTFYFIEDSPAAIELK
jgi:hypothetical protein